MKIEDLNEDEKEYLKDEIDLYNSGLIDDEIFDKLLEKARVNIEKNKNEKSKERVTNLIKLLKKRPDYLSNFSKFIEYRRLRVEQVVYLKLIDDAKNSYGQDCDNLNIDRMQDSLYSLDKRRRQIHNTALSNFCALISACHKNDIPLIYTGRLMDPAKEKDNYGDHKIREEMTDGMLGLLSDIENIKINELNIDTELYNEKIGNFKQIHEELNKQTRSYGLKRPFEKDDETLDILL